MKIKMDVKVNSFVEDVEKELLKAERRLCLKAAKHVKDRKILGEKWLD